MNKIRSFRTPRIIFGNNSIERIGESAKSLGAEKTLIICSKSGNRYGTARKIADLLKAKDIGSGIFDGIEPEPSTATTVKCTKVAKEGGYDFIIGLGGGSPIDVSKVVSVLATNKGMPEDYLGFDKVKVPGLKKIYVPTTAGSGSEATHVSVLIGKDKGKVVVYSPYLFADLVIVDPMLTLTLPKKPTAETGMDALSHAIESYTSVNATALTEPLALKAIELIGKSLENAVEDGTDVRTRYDLSLAALLAGISFINAGVNAGHALGLAIGGKYGIPHGLSIASVLPGIVEFNQNACLSKFKTIAQLLGGENPVKAVKDLSSRIGIPQKLSDIGVKAEDIPEVAEIAFKAQRLLSNNPRDITKKDIEDIYMGLL